MINENNKWKIDYNFEKDGKYEFQIIFKNKITNLYNFIKIVQIYILLIYQILIIQKLLIWQECLMNVIN